MAVAAKNGKSTPTVVPDDRVAPKAGEKDPEPRGVTAGAVQDPFSVEVSIVGVADILFHRYDVDAIEMQSKAAKGSKIKKSDNIESYLYRNRDGTLGLPGIVFKACLSDAARSFQDPRSPRKSARDLVKAAIAVQDGASFGVRKHDYTDKRRACVGQAAVTRHRPALEAGWKITFIVDVLDPEYVAVDFLSELVTRAGRSQGLCDYRPDFGRFRVASFKRLRA